MPKFGTKGASCTRVDSEKFLCPVRSDRSREHNIAASVKKGTGCDITIAVNDRTGTRDDPKYALDVSEL